MNSDARERRKGGVHATTVGTCVDQPLDVAPRPSRSTRTEITLQLGVALVRIAATQLDAERKLHIVDLRALEVKLREAMARPARAAMATRPD